MYAGARTSSARHSKRRAPRNSFVLGLLLVLVLPLLLGFGFWQLWRVSRPSVPAADVVPASSSASAVPAAQPKNTAAAAAVPVQTQPRTVSLMAVGDNLIHNTVYWSAEQADGSYDFTPMYQDIRPIVQQYDLAAINQETIFVNDPAQYSNYPYFGSPTAVGTALAEMGFDIVTQATNHCYDKLDRGILDTVGFWRENYPGMTVLGIHDSQADADTIRVVERSGIRLAMLNYTYGLNYSVPANKYMVDTLDDPDKIAADIEKAKAKSDLVIVFVHWGTEDSTVPSADQRSWAQFFADHGVGLVIGSGPHALQPMQTVTGADGNEVPVYYSLGNFLSHQKDPLNMLGGMASVTIEKDDSGTFVRNHFLYPTMTVILPNAMTGWYTYRPMMLMDYNDAISRQHIVSGVSMNEMWDLYYSIVGKP